MYLCPNRKCKTIQVKGKLFGDGPTDFRKEKSDPWGLHEGGPAFEKVYAWRKEEIPEKGEGNGRVRIQKTGFRSPGPGGKKKDPGKKKTAAKGKKTLKCRQPKTSKKGGGTCPEENPAGNSSPFGGGNCNTGRGKEVGEKDVDVDPLQGKGEKKA